MGMKQCHYMDLVASRLTEEAFRKAAVMLWHLRMTQYHWERTLSVLLQHRIFSWFIDCLPPLTVTAAPLIDSFAKDPSPEPLFLLNACCLPERSCPLQVLLACSCPIRAWPALQPLPSATAIAPSVSESTLLSLGPTIRPRILERSISGLDDLRQQLALWFLKQPLGVVLDTRSEPISVQPRL